MEANSSVELAEQKEVAATLRAHSDTKYRPERSIYSNTFGHFFEMFEYLSPAVSVLLLMSLSSPTSPASISSTELRKHHAFIDILPVFAGGWDDDCAP